MNKTDALAMTAAKTYADNTALLTAVTAIPYVGGPLDVLFSAKGQKMTHTRILTLLDELKQAMAEVEEESVRKEFLESEEFFDLTMKALEASSRTRHAAKIRRGRSTASWCCRFAKRTRRCRLRIT